MAVYSKILKLDHPVQQLARHNPHLALRLPRYCRSRPMADDAPEVTDPLHRQKGRVDLAPTAALFVLQKTDHRPYAPGHSTHNALKHVHLVTKVPLQGYCPFLLGRP